MSAAAPAVEKVAGSATMIYEELRDSVTAWRPEGQPDVRSGQPHISVMGTVSVLVVEDDPLQQASIGLLFEQANEKNCGAVVFQYVLVSTASEAVDALRADDAPAFNLILLDLILPDQPAFELLPTVRQLVGSEVAIIIASAHTQLALVQICMRRGADAFLVKPLGSEVVRHIWQFVKEIPDCSFKQDRDESVSSSFGLRSGGSPSTTTAVDESGLQKSVLQMVQLTDEVAQIEISYAADTDYQQQGGPTETDVDPSAARIGDPSSQPNPQIGSVIVCGGCSTSSHSHSTPILRSSSSTTLHQAAEHDSQLDDSQAEAVNIAAPPSRHASEQPHADLPGSQERVGRRRATQSSTDSAHTFDDDAVGADCKQQ